MVASYQAGTFWNTMIHRIITLGGIKTVEWLIDIRGLAVGAMFGYDQSYDTALLAYAVAVLHCNIMPSLACLQHHFLSAFWSETSGDFVDYQAT
jgi:hypothetical protein